MNLLEAKEILRKKGYTTHRLNECGGSSDSYSSGCGGSSSYSYGCGGSGCSSSYSSGCSGRISYGGGCSSISRSVRVGCGSGGYISNSCSSSGCGSYYYDDDKDDDKPPKYIFSKGKSYEYTGYNSYYGCAEYTNSRLGKTILNIDHNHRPTKFAKIIFLARKLHTNEVRVIEIIERLYKSGINREIAYNTLSKLDKLPEKLLRLPIEHVKC